MTKLSRAIGMMGNGVSHTTGEAMKEDYTSPKYQFTYDPGDPVQRYIFNELSAGTDGSMRDGGISEEAHLHARDADGAAVDYAGTILNHSKHSSQNITKPNPMDVPPLGSTARSNGVYSEQFSSIHGLLDDMTSNLTSLSSSPSLSSSTTSFPGYVNLHNLTSAAGNSNVEFPLYDNYTDCDLNLTSIDICWPLRDNTTNSTMLEEIMEPRYWVLFLCLFPMLTVFGNCLVVCAVYRERALQTATNYFIVSLAVADIMVGVLVMPLAVYVEVSALTAGGIDVLNTVFYKVRRVYGIATAYVIIVFTVVVVAVVSSSVLCVVISMLRCVPWAPVITFVMMYTLYTERIKHNSGCDSTFSGSWCLSM